MIGEMYCLVKSGASGDYIFFLRLLLFIEPQTTQTDAKIIYDSCCCNLLFLRILRISVVNPCRPFRSSNLVPRLAVVGGVLPLSSRTAEA